jgi:hypothetical protein
LHLPPGAQSFLSLPLQRRSNEAVARNDRTVTALGQFRVVLSALELLLPMVIQALTFLPHVRLGLQAQF